MVGIRAATLEDAEELSRLASETFLDGWAAVIGDAVATAYAQQHLTAEKLRGEIQDGETHHFALAVHRETSAIIGYGKMDLKRAAHESVTGPRPVVLQRLYVSRSARGRGVANVLLANCETEAARRGFKTIWLECDPRNQRAWRFYEKCGFLPRGTMSYPLPGGVNDQVRVMERPLAQDFP